MLASAPRTASASLFGSLSSVPDNRTPLSLRSSRSLPLSSHAQPIRHLPSPPAQHQRQNKQLLRCASTTEAQPVADEDAVEGMSEFLDSLKWDDAGLVAAIVQVTLPHHFQQSLIVLIDKHMKHLLISNVQGGVRWLSAGYYVLTLIKMNVLLVCPQQACI